MSAEQVAREHYVGRRRLAEAIAGVAGQIWKRIDPGNLDRSWQQYGPQLVVGLAGVQLAAARSADDYLSTALGEQGIYTAPVAALNPSMLAGVASDGRPLDSLLLNAITTVKAGIAGGATIERAMAAGYANLDMLVRTQVADAGRAADQVALVANPAAGGYTRMLVGDSCSRCLVLAGRWYRWSDGFLRHPRCNCVHRPGRDPAGGALLDPRRAFEAMSLTEQDKTFTIAGAQAIRDGSDIYRVVNARRGMYLAAGRRFTTEATTRRGINRKLRLMPEQIYREAAGDRDEAVRLLRFHGYLTASAPRPARPARPAAVTVPQAVTASTGTQSALQRGIASGIREAKPLSGGEVGDVRLVTFNDGSQAIHKTAHKPYAGYSPKDLTDHEYLAARVGQALGAPVPEVIRTGDVEVFMEYVSDARPATNVFRKYKAAERPAKIAEFIDTREGRLLGLVDLLIANGDRHTGNWLVRKNGNIVGIDHGIAWPTGQITQEKVDRWAASFNSPFADMFNEGSSGNLKPSKGWIPNNLSQQDMRWIRDQLNALRPEFEALGRGDWLNYSLARLRQMVEWASGEKNLVKP